MGLRDVGQTVASIAVLEDSNPVDLAWTPADMPALQPGAAHPCPYLLDDEIAFQLGDGPMMMMTARPSGPPVSRFSLKLTNSTPR